MKGLILGFEQSVNRTGTPQDGSCEKEERTRRDITVSARQDKTRQDITVNGRQDEKEERTRRHITVDARQDVEATQDRIEYIRRQHKTG